MTHPPSPSLSSPPTPAPRPSTSLSFHPRYRSPLPAFPHTQVPTIYHAKEYPDDPPALTLTLFASHSGAAPLGPISITASCSAPVYLNADAVTLPSLPPGRAGTPIPFTFRASADQLPTDLAACFLASYTSAVGEARCAMDELKWGGGRAKKGKGGGRWGRKRRGRASRCWDAVGRGKVCRVGSMGPSRTLAARSRA